MLGILLRLYSPNLPEVLKTFGWLYAAPSSSLWNLPSHSGCLVGTLPILQVATPTRPHRTALPQSARTIPYKFARASQRPHLSCSMWRASMGWSPIRRFAFQSCFCQGSQSSVCLGTETRKLQNLGLGVQDVHARHLCFWESVWKPDFAGFSQKQFPKLVFLRRGCKACGSQLVCLRTWSTPTR